MKIVRDAPQAPAVPAGSSEAHAGTRQRVAFTLLENGPATAGALAERLELTSAAVRRHLDALAEDGMVETRQARTYGHRGRGRPARVFALTDAGRDAFFQAYDDLAASALRFLADSAGEAAVATFARQRVAELESRYAATVNAAAPGNRTNALATALTADGYAASAQEAPSAVDGEQLCQHHCPVAHVAEQFPQLCEAETEAFGRLLGRHVQRLATIAHGDGVCTTFIPSPSDRSTTQTTQTSQSMATTSTTEPAHGRTNA